MRKLIQVDTYNRYRFFLWTLSFLKIWIHFLIPDVHLCNTSYYVGFESCSYIYIYIYFFIYVYLQPKWDPLFLIRVWTLFWRVKNHQNRGKTGSRYIYIYLLVLPAKMFKHVISLNTQNLTSWWSNQPHLKNMLVKLDHFPKVSG